MRKPAAFTEIVRTKRRQVFADDFNRSNGPAGVPWTAVPNSPPLAAIVNNALVGSTGMIDTGSDDNWAEADILADANSAGILCRANLGTSNYYLLRYSTNTLGLFRAEVGGSFTQLWQRDIPFTQPLRIGIAAKGNIISCYRNGVRCVDYKDDTPILTGTYAGARNLAGDNIIDNFACGVFYPN